MMNPKLVKIAFEVAELVMLKTDQLEIVCGISIWSCKENPWMVVRCREQGGTLAIQKAISEDEMDLSAELLAQLIVDEFVDFRQAIAS